ncbi:hypothetical protein D3C87_905700 [compost metagenome]
MASSEGCDDFRYLRRPVAWLVCLLLQQTGGKRKREMDMEMKMKNVTDVIFADEAEKSGEFARGFAWGCASSSGLCLVIVLLAAAFGG